MDYIKTNQSSWDSKTQDHIESEFYDNDTFLKGRSSLNKIELDLLGDIKGKRILHLQCHFGQDTLSLARMGAKVTGVDFSEAAVNKAREMAVELNLDAEFICCNIYDLSQHLNEEFDIVFTSYGTIIWLPDLKPWAQLVHKYLSPKGRFIFVDFHPFIWMYDDNFTKLTFKYSDEEAIVEEIEGSYANFEVKKKHKNITWNHSLSDVIGALTKSNMQLLDFQEYDYSPYPAFGQATEFEPGKWRIQPFEDKPPLVYSLMFTKPS